MPRQDAMTLAVVDDDDDVRTALKRLLQAMDYRVVGFASAEDFEARTVEVDCAIIDMRLPGVSGLELCERLRQRSTPTPVVLVTGDAHRLATDVPAAADTPVLNKPFDETTLSNAIADAMASVAAYRVD
jgi:two-component system, LuxR family, response regulator TtrR